MIEDFFTRGTMDRHYWLDVLIEAYLIEIYRMGGMKQQKEQCKRGTRGR